MAFFNKKHNPEPSLEPKKASKIRIFRRLKQPVNIAFTKLSNEQSGIITLKLLISLIVYVIDHVRI